MEWTCLMLVSWTALLRCVGGQVDPELGDPFIPEESDINFPQGTGSTPTIGEINWNDTIDYLLSLTNNNTLSNGRDEVSLRDVVEPFTRKIGPLSVRGEFTASGGRLSGLSSVRRRGGVVVTQTGRGFTMTCPVGLDHVAVRYNHYRIKVRRGPSMSGAIEGQIQRNTVQVTASIDLGEEECQVRLDEVKITELSDLEVRVQGLMPPLDDLVSKITTWLTKVFKDDIQRNLERWLTRELTKGLERSQCEKVAGYFIFVDPK